MEVPRQALIIRKFSTLEYQEQFDTREYQRIADHQKLYLSDQKHKLNVLRLEQCLVKAQIAYKIIPGHVAQQRHTQCPSCQALQQGHPYQLVISAGGDGTALFAAWHLLKTPLLIFKSAPASKGALAAVTPEDLEEKLELLSQGEFYLEKWTRVEVRHEPFEGPVCTYRGLNEVIIGGDTLRIDKTARYLISQGNSQERHVNSGIVIATGAGSSGWPALFQPQERTVPKLFYKTLLPIEGTKNEGVVTPQTPLTIVSQMHNQKGAFALDSKDTPLLLDRGDRLHIGVSQYPLMVVRFGNQTKGTSVRAPSYSNHRLAEHKVD